MFLWRNKKNIDTFELKKKSALTSVMASNEYPRHMFSLRNKNDISIFRMKKAPYLFAMQYHAVLS